MISALSVPAERFGRSMFTGRRRRSTPLYGVTLHTTGSSLPKKAGGDGQRALADAVQIYTRSGGPHYVIGWDGTIVATVADENIRGAHAGIAESTIRSLYRSGGWESRVSPRGVELWRARWPGRRSPVDIIPDGKLEHINDYWIGVEMIPVTPGGSTFWAEPAYSGSRFTGAQHRAARRLAHDIARRHGFPSGWASPKGTRLLGHSDLNPIGRDTASLPLWDPGYHTGMFDMNRVRGIGWWWLVPSVAALWWLKRRRAGA